MDKTEQPIKKQDQLRTIEAKKRMLEALKSTLGIVTPALEKAEVARGTFYNWLERDPEFAEACKEADEIALDFAESKLHKLIKDENPTTIIFYMKTKGKKRGYIERQEIDQTGNQTIIFENVSNYHHQDDPDLVGDDQGK